MNKGNMLTLDLPNLTPTVILPRHLGKTLKYVVAAGTKGISTVELVEAGCSRPSQAISNIKKHGAFIRKELRDVEDKYGEVHPRVAHYTYCGWLFDAACPYNTTNPCKESA